MPKITKIVAQSSNPKRVNVFVDNKFLTGIDRFIWIERHLKVGDEISSQLCTDLKVQDDENKIYEKALKLLSYRPQSIKEMQQKLAQRFDMAAIKKIIVRLQQADLLDDRRFATSWIRERLQTRLRSMNHLTAELRGKGIDRDIIQEALESAQVLRHEAQTATALVRKLNRPDDNLKLSEKTKAYLARRGFPYKTIVEVDKQLKN